MISVQNRLQPLSGSKTLWLCGFFLVVIVSCSALIETKQGNTSSKNSVIEKDTVKRKPVLVEDTLKQQSDTLYVTDTVYLKDVYHIALILPFHLDSVKNQQIDEEIYPPTNLALEFYKGVQVALDSLRKSGLNLRLHVFDYAKSSGKLKEILKQPVLKEMDYIVGPFFPFYLKYVTEFAKKHQIPAISPLSPDTSIARRNPYTIMFTPSARPHCRTITKYMLQKYPQSNYLFMHTKKEKMKPEEQNFKNYFQNYFKKGQDTTFSLLEMEELAHEQPPKEDIEKRLLPGDTNIIYLASLDQSYVYYVFSQLEQLQSDSNYHLKVFGPPTWLKYESIDIKYFNILNVHTTSSYWINIKGKRIKRFRQSYIEKYYTEPSRFAYQAYDIFAYIGRICLNYGNYYDYGFKRLKGTGTCMQFNVEPVIIRDTIERFENQHVNLLQIKDFEIKEIK